VIAHTRRLDRRGRGRAARASRVGVDRWWSGSRQMGGASPTADVPRPAAVGHGRYACDSERRTIVIAPCLAGGGSYGGRPDRMVPDEARPVRGRPAHPKTGDGWWWTAGGKGPPRRTRYARRRSRPGSAVTGPWEPSPPEPQALIGRTPRTTWCGSGAGRCGAAIEQHRFPQPRALDSLPPARRRASRVTALAPKRRNANRNISLKSRGKSWDLEP